LKQHWTSIIYIIWSMDQKHWYISYMLYWI